MRVVFSLCWHSCEKKDVKQKTSQGYTVYICPNCGIYAWKPKEEIIFNKIIWKKKKK